MSATGRHFKATEGAPSMAAGISVAARAGRLLCALVGSCIVALAICLVMGAVSGFSGAWFNRFWFSFFAVCGFVVGSMVLNRDWLAHKPENLYLIVVLCVTMLLSWTMSIRQIGWDVGTHWKNVLIFADWEGDVELSSADYALVHTEPVHVDDEGLFAQINAAEEVLDSSTGDVAEIKERPKSPVWYITGVEYVPYALALRVCRALNVPFSRTLVVVRMVGVIFYSVVTYLGMRKLRHRKMLYAALALLPTSVFLAADLGYSYWLFSLCLYGFASLVGMLQGSVRVSVGSVLKMLGALFLGMLPRVAYFPLMFLCLLIPTSKFPSERFARTYRVLLVGSAIAAFGVWLVPKLLSGFGGGDTRGGEVNAAGQISYILSHPLEYLRTFARFALPPLAMEGGAPDKEGVNLIGGFLSIEASPGLLVNYGYLQRPHVAYTVVMWVVLLWTTLTDKDRTQKMGVLPGVLSLVLTFGVFVMIATALYMDFTPVGLPQINGVQRRYLIPLMFPLLAFVGPRVLGVHELASQGRLAAYNLVVLGGMAVVLLCSWWTTYLVLMA